jgi:hypothetical protein
MRFSDLWTEKDGVTLDIKRVLVIPASVAAPVGLQVADVLHGRPFAAKDFCEGMGVVIAAIGALLAAHALAKGENSGDSP